MTIKKRPARRGVLAALLLSLALPATALAAAPAISDTRSSDVGQNAATAKASVDPNGNETTAFFQYGTSKIYGSSTPPAAIGKGSTKVPVSAAIGSLAPYTTYHYRAVAQYGVDNKLVFGADHTFKTKKQPLGITLAASPTRVHSGGATVLGGTVSGTGYEGKQVQLQTNPFPYSAFADTGNPQVIGKEGTFSFPVLDVFVNSAFRVLIEGNTDVVSPIVSVAVPVQVRLKIGAKVLKKHRHRFTGRITPSSPGAAVEIQRRFHGVWIAVAKTKVRSSGAGSSFFSKKLRVTRSGRYRAYAFPDGRYTESHSAVHRVRVK